MNFRKKLAIGVLALAGYVGTFYNSGGLPPFYTVKKGESGGICVGLVTKLEEGSKFYGFVVSGLTINKGEVDGAITALANRSDSGKVNGAEVGLIVNSNPAVGDYAPTIINGLQGSIFYNFAALESKCVQVGTVNRLQFIDEKKTKTRITFLINNNASFEW